MSKRISFSIIPDRKNIDRSMKLALEYGAEFEYNDFMMPDVLDDAEECRRRIQFYKTLSRDRSRDTMHGAFLDITIHSTDSMIRKASEKRVYQSMEIAQELGVRGVVFHTGLIACYHDAKYKNLWEERNTVFWKEVLRDFPNLEVYMENMFEQNPVMLKRIGKSMASEDRFGLCLDYAHASAFGRYCEIGSWLRELAPYVKHMHINDNDLQDDLHLPVGEGYIDWDRFGQMMWECRIYASVLIETEGYDAQKKSLEYLKQKGILDL